MIEENGGNTLKQPKSTSDYRANDDDDGVATRAEYS